MLYPLTFSTGRKKNARSACNPYYGKFLKVFAKASAERAAAAVYSIPLYLRFRDS
jgi:hypothetical protein